MITKRTNYHDLYLHFFTSRIIDTWKDLPAKVIFVNSTEKLKINIDKPFSTLMHSGVTQNQEAPREIIDRRPPTPSSQYTRRPPSQTSTHTYASIL